MKKLGNHWLFSTIITIITFFIYKSKTYALNAYLGQTSGSAGVFRGFIIGLRGSFGALFEDDKIQAQLEASIGLWACFFCLSFFFTVIAVVSKIYYTVKGKFFKAAIKLETSSDVVNVDFRKQTKLTS